MPLRCKALTPRRIEWVLFFNDNNKDYKTEDELCGFEHLVMASDACEAGYIAENSNNPQPSMSGVGSPGTYPHHERKPTFSCGLGTKNTRDNN